jgi:heat shock protein HslJ
MAKPALVFVSLLAGLALIAAACGDDSSTHVGADGNSLSGPWILVDSLVDGTPLALLADYAVTMNIKDGQLGGRAACNNYGGNLTVTETDFRSSEVFQNEMGCEEPAMSLEFAYLSALTRVEFWVRSGDVAELTGEGVSLTFAVVSPPPTTDLFDTTWELDTIIHGETASGAIGGTDTAQLSLDVEGRITGSTGCRTFVGEFIETGGTITITNFALEGICGGDFLSQDNAIVSVLEGEVTVTVDGQHLTLMAAGGEGLRYTAS